MTRSEELEGRGSQEGGERRAPARVWQLFRRERRHDPPTRGGGRARAWWATAGAWISWSTRQNGGEVREPSGRRAGVLDWGRRAVGDRAFYRT